MLAEGGAVAMGVASGSSLVGDLRGNMHGCRGNGISAPIPIPFP